MGKWKTGISTVYWAEYQKDKQYKIREAELCLGAENSRHPVSWLDELFRGEIKVSNNNPITLLIKGPPGSGKTTFALELCYRLAKNATASTYVSLESESSQIIENATDFGWQEDVMKQIQTNAKDKEAFLNVCGSEHAESQNQSTDNMISAGADIATNMLMTAASTGDFITITTVSILTLIKDLSKLPFSKLKFKNPFSRNTNTPKLPNSQILVIDSLNIFPLNEREEAFRKILEIARKSPEKQKIKLILFILDAKSNIDSNPFWEYVCDTVIELNHYENNNYFLRTIEIVKSRFQQQVLGKHQFKIYSKPNDNKTNVNDIGDIDTLSRMHPVRKEGGIFIFPSIHFYLSKYGKFTQSGELDYDATFPNTFSDFLAIQPKTKEGGFPAGRCTALIGCRGGHKSHLAYLHILARLTGKYQGGKPADAENNVALIISLRDDEKMITATLNGILDNEFPKKGWNVENFVANGRLEILYYPPGYISPEEFIHRIFVSIHKLKIKKKKVTVIFNSIDQIGARFPLCAKLDIFIPSIIQILIGESITSIFIAVDEKDQPVEQYGLLPMADLILSFHQYQMTLKQYNDILNIGKSKRNLEKEEGQKREEIILTVERFAGGKKGGAKGLLELGNNNMHGKNVISFVEIPSSVFLERNRLKK